MKEREINIFSKPLSHLGGEDTSKKSVFSTDQSHTYAFWLHHTDKLENNNDSEIRWVSICLGSHR